MLVGASMKNTLMYLLIKLTEVSFELPWLCTFSGIDWSLVIYDVFKPLGLEEMDLGAVICLLDLFRSMSLLAA